MKSILVNTEVALSELLKVAINHRSLVAIDTETDGLNTTQGYNKICGISLSFDGELGYYIPVRHTTGKNVSLQKTLMIVKNLINKCPVVFHNAKFDIPMLSNEGINFDNVDIHDTMLMSYCFDCSRMSHGLKALVLDLLEYKMQSFDDVTKGVLFCNLDAEQGADYAADDATCTFQLYNYFNDHEYFDDCRDAYEIERKVVSAVIAMEAQRVFVDTDLLAKTIISHTEVFNALKKDIEDLSGLSNINSVHQWRKYLYEDLDVQYDENWGLTKTGEMKVTKMIHGIIKGDVEASEKKLAFDNVKKELSTYLLNMQQHLYPDNSLKFSFKQTGAVTGRFSASGGNGLKPEGKKPSDGYSGVNAQNIPYRKLGSILISRTGFKTVTIDYSQQELRAAANLSNETALIDKFLLGIDGHRATASVAFNIEPEEVEDWQRSIGKTINFAILYGAGPQTVMENLNAKLPDGFEPYSLTDATDLMNEFFNQAPNLRDWIKDKSEEVMTNGYLAYTELGRIRPMQAVVDLNKKISDFALEKKLGRFAVSTQIQGICADLTKIALIRVHNYVKKFRDEIKLLAMVHDSFIFDIRIDVIEKHVAEITKIMALTDILTDKLNWKVPLIVDVTIKDNWSK